MIKSVKDVASFSLNSIFSEHRGQTRADFFKSLHESAKSAVGELFADFLQTFFHEMQTFCRLFLWTNFFHAHLLQTFCRLSVANDSSSTDFMPSTPVSPSKATASVSIIGNCRAVVLACTGPAAGPRFKEI